MRKERGSAQFGFGSSANDGSCDDHTVVNRFPCEPHVPLLNFLQKTN